jgi:hypothetical protein
MKTDTKVNSIFYLAAATVVGIIVLAFIGAGFLVSEFIMWSMG